MLCLLTQRQFGLCVKRSIYWLRDHVERVTVWHDLYSRYCKWWFPFAETHRDRCKTDSLARDTVALGVDLLEEIRSSLVRFDVEYNYRMGLFQASAKTDALDARQHRLARGLLRVVYGCDVLAKETLQELHRRVEREQHDMEALREIFRQARERVADIKFEWVDRDYRDDGQVKEALLFFLEDARLHDVAKQMEKWLFSTMTN